jgi:hypothetical protein
MVMGLDVYKVNVVGHALNPPPESRADPALGQNPSSHSRHRTAYRPATASRTPGVRNRLSPLARTSRKDRAARINSVTAMPRARFLGVTGLQGTYQSLWLPVLTRR